MLWNEICCMNKAWRHYKEEGQLRKAGMGRAGGEVFVSWPPGSVLQRGCWRASGPFPGVAMLYQLAQHRALLQYVTHC